MRIRFPQYYDLITPKGLEVYVWQTADNVYYCGLLPGTNAKVKYNSPDALSTIVNNAFNNMYAKAE